MPTKSISPKPALPVRSAETAFYEDDASRQPLLRKLLQEPLFIILLVWAFAFLMAWICLRLLD